MNAKTIKLIAKIESAAAVGKSIDATSLICSFGFNAPVGKAIAHLVAMGALVEAGKTSLGQPMYKAVA